MSEERAIQDDELWDEFWYAGGSSGHAVRDCPHGITWFASYDRGCFDDGELEELQAKAETQPDKYRDIGEGSVHFSGFLGKDFCWHCQQCRREALRYQTIVWDHRHQIAHFLNAKLESEEKRAAQEKKSYSIPL